MFNKLKEFYYKKILPRDFKAWFRVSRPKASLVDIVSEAKENFPLLATKKACAEYLKADRKRYAREAEKNQEVSEEFVKNIEVFMNMQHLNPEETNEIDGIKAVNNFLSHGKLFSKPVKQEELERAYSLGMFRVFELKDGKYYYGHCRNAKVAKWNETTCKFTYMRYKFGCLFPEDINHPENDDGYDLFIPVAECLEPREEEKIP